MMFMNAAFFLGLIVLAMGIYLYIWSSRNKGAGIGTAKIVGIVMIVLSILAIIFIGYHHFMPMQNHNMM